VVPAFFNPKDMVVQQYTPNGVMNAVFFWTSSLIAIWWYPE
jgi:hypothetical protein